MNAGNKGRWSALVGLCLAAGLVWLAFADLSVALPTISTERSIDLTDLQWSNNAFSLTCGALVLAAGRFGDQYGRRRMLLVGTVVFGVFSLLTAFLSGLAGLVTGRALMGVGAALILPATLALIPPLFPRSEQPTAFGAWMATAWVGQAAGPAVGGALTSTLGWRSLFWIAAPLAAVAYVIVARYAPESKDEQASRHIDVPGLLTSVAAAFCLLYALTEGQEVGFGDPLIIGMLIAAVLLAVAFVLFERSVHEPLVDLQLFRARDFDGALVANLVMNVVFAGISYLFAIYLQEVRGYSALEAGLLLFPSTLTILALNPVGSRISARRGPRQPVAWGLALLALGTFAAGFVSPTSAYWLLLVGLLVLGAGLGLLSVPISDTAVAGPPEELAGTASGLFKMSSMLGGAFGVAMLSAVAQALQTREGTQEAQAAGLDQASIDQLRNALTDSALGNQLLASLTPDQRDAVINGLHQAQAAGTGGAVKVAALLALIAVPLVLWLWPRPTRTTPDLTR